MYSITTVFSGIISSMTYKTHLSTGMLFSATAFLLVISSKCDTSGEQCLLLTPVLILTLVLSTWLGASAPDLDTPTGELWHKIPAGSFIGRLIHPAFIGGHRHLSHSILGMAIFTFLFYLLAKFIFGFYPGLDMHNAILAFVIGYFSHIFADSLTEAGVPILFPIGYHFGIPPDPFGKMRIKTGKWFENLLVYPLVNILLAYVIYQSVKIYPENFVHLF